MHRHQIILSSSYSTGRRICLHITDCDEESFFALVQKVGQAYDGKDVPFSVHSIVTDSAEWTSVVSNDPYFGDVTVLDSVDDFISLLQKDRYLTGLDVANYILSKESCTHTRLEKLTYMCYAEYLCQYGEKLFLDEIYAFDYGPVIESVYERYSGHSRQHPVTPINEPECGKHEKMPIKSRILFSEDGQKKIDSIERSLKYYSSFTTEDLIYLTHKEQTPWKVSRKLLGQYKKIADDDILRYHMNETKVE